MKLNIHLWVNLLIVLISVECLLSISITGLKKNHHRKSKSVEEGILQSAKEETKLLSIDELPDQQVYFTGWIKYLHYTLKEKKKPKAFYRNSAFDAQQKKNLNSSALKATDAVFNFIQNRKVF